MSSENAKVGREEPRREGTLRSSREQHIRPRQLKIVLAAPREFLSRFESPKPAIGNGSRIVAITCSPMHYSSTVVIKAKGAHLGSPAHLSSTLHCKGFH
jgi:hypothetical protein